MKTPFSRDRTLARARNLARGARTLWRTRRRLSFARRSVLIVGGSRGLGLELARCLVAEGARVALMARDPDELERARRELGADVTVVSCDVRDRDATRRAVSDLAARHGGIDLLVNDAGVIHVGPLAQMGEEDFAEALDVHFWGALHTMLAAIPFMKAQRHGRIVNIASVGGMVAVPHLAPYCASKFAQVGLSDAMRNELGRYGIAVTTVCPWLMRTGSYRQAMLKGQRGRELAWFGVGSALPIATLSSERAARRILRAPRFGDPVLHLGGPARALIVANAVAPRLVASVMQLVGLVLPDPIGTTRDPGARGWDVTSRWAPSSLTTLADRAAVRNNETAGPRLPANGDAGSFPA
jgi:NAD(P)-dependent dehydrogenase (short-subunit alcohol dehydrogenase family)